MKGRRRIAPRLLSGESREAVYNALPAPIKAWIRMMAERDQKSVNYYMEGIILEHYARQQRRSMTRLTDHLYKKREIEE